MKLRRGILGLLFTAAFTGCSLYNEVSISPLVLNPAQIQRGADLQGMLRKADYLRAIEYSQAVENRTRRSATELSALGAAELAAGRFDAARRHLRAALDLNPFRETAQQIAWSLSQVEYLTNNYEASLEWALSASNYGLVVKQWHIELLRALSQKDVYRVPGLPSAQVPMRFTRPDVPRIVARINRAKELDVVIDSGAVTSIISKKLADEMSIKSLGDFEGTFYGLLSEPIQVKFALLDSIEIGDLRVENIPVAIMPDEKMSFVVSGKREFKIDFLLGANFLKEFRTDLDFPHGVVTFTKLTSLDRRPAEDQNLFFEGFRPLVRGTVNRHGWYVFVLDTGSEITFLNEKQYLSLPIQQMAPKVHDAMLQGLGGAKKRGQKIDNVEIGVDRWAGSFRSVPMYTSGEHESAAGILGENFLKKFRVIIDFGRMRVDLIRPGEGPRAQSFLAKRALAAGAP